ncbi:MAG TPA: TolC family protein, partial [Longimicrobiales bacterium]|nr:TolC family protein [Longimicrobiales bacterium]
QGVVTRVRVAYYQLLLQQEQLRLIEKSVQRVRASLEETRALNRAGLASDYDVLRLEVELGNLEPNLLRASNAVHQSQRQMALELDLPQGQPVAVEGSLAEMDLTNVAANDAANRQVLAFAGFGGEGLEELDRALGMAEELRSDLRQLQLTESLRKTEMRLEQVEYIPRITFFGNYVINAQDNGSPNFFARGDGQRAYGRNIGVRVSVPIFQGFRRDARIDQKRAALRQAETQTQLAEDQARLQVQNLVEQADEAHLRAQGQRRAVGQAQRGFEIASAQYREGLSSQLELTDAEVALRQSEFNYAQAVYDYLVARAQLDQATGRVPLVDVDVRATDGFED